MLRYRDHSGGITHKSLSRLDSVLPKLGRIISVKGYRYKSVVGGYETWREAVMVRGTNGTARFEGLLWGYPGEGPRGLRSLLTRLGVSPSKADTVAFYTCREHKLGTDWTLDFSEPRLSMEVR